MLDYLSDSVNIINSLVTNKFKNLNYLKKNNNFLIVFFKILNFNLKSAKYYRSTLLKLTKI